MKKRVLIVFGTRPEAIKMAPLVLKLKELKNISTSVCITAQHREMLDMVLDIFAIKPDYDLNLMRAKQSITDITNRVLSGMEHILAADKPDLVIVQGDTTTTMATALAAFYKKIPIGHVEAGLRSGDIYSPYPEEMNRRITSTLASIHFAPTEGNRVNLIKSGINKDTIYVTGNTVIDALYMVVKDDYKFPIEELNNLDFNNKKVILLTAHRRENWGKPMKAILNAVKKVIIDNTDTELVFPVHLNPVVKDTAAEVFDNHPRFHLFPPMDYVPFANLMARCYMVLTDSGGIQEEAPALGKPVLVLRTETERPEAVDAGTVKIVGVKKKKIIRVMQELLDDKSMYDDMAKAINPYGDGLASERTIKLILKWLLKEDK